jgi:PKD repeat protein
MIIKRKLLFAVIIMILLSANALAVPMANDKNVIIVTNPQDKCAINIKPLVADFDIIASFSTAPPTINFIDKSIGSPTSWSWDFGDNNISITQNPIHKYNVPRIYNVTFTVKNFIHSGTVKKKIIFTGYEKYES